MEDEVRYKIEGHPQYMKVGHAVVNVDKSAYETWLAQQLEKRELVDRIDRLEKLVGQLINKD